MKIIWELTYAIVEKQKTKGGKMGERAYTRGNHEVEDEISHISTLMWAHRRGIGTSDIGRTHSSLGTALSNRL